eukprot:2138293-Amphidinium_carterae.1
MVVGKLAAKFSSDPCDLSMCMSPSSDEARPCIGNAGPRAIESKIKVRVHTSALQLSSAESQRGNVQRVCEPLFVPSDCVNLLTRSASSAGGHRRAASWPPTVDTFVWHKLWGSTATVINLHAIDKLLQGSMKAHVLVGSLQILRSVRVNRFAN